MKTRIHINYFALLLGLIFSTSAHAQSNLDRWNTDGNLGDTTKFLGTTDSQPVLFRTDGAERMRITANGRLGINVKKPQARLDVKGNVQFRNDLLLPGLVTLPTPLDNQYSLLFSDAQGTTFRLNYSEFLKKLTPDVYGYPELPPNFLSICELAGYLDNPVWHNGPNKIFSECSEVRVGIGTSTPRSTLDVIGTTFSEQVAIGIAPANASAQLHIKSSLTNPSYKLLTVENSTRKLLELDNAGLLHAREIKVDLQTWPDYVFEHDYDLRPLKELAAYIQKEGHLPNVPSAKEIEENGMNVGEMNKILMEKLEELTLYVIDLQDQVDEQNARIIELQIKE